MHGFCLKVNKRRYAKIFVVECKDLDYLEENLPIIWYVSSVVSQNKMKSTILYTYSLLI